MDVQEPARTVLAECFRKFGIETVTMENRFMERMVSEKWMAALCVWAVTLRGSCRRRGLRRRTAALSCTGLAGQRRIRLSISRFGVNAVFTEPLERQTALKLVKATHSLVLHEFRRYVRVPVATEVAVTTSDGRRFAA